MNILIVEDEEFIQKDLKRKLGKCNITITSLSWTDSVISTISFLKKNTPDLIFMDIQLSDGISFEILDSINVVSPVIFTTAYDEYAIQAFQLNSIDYLLKPIDQEKLNKSITKFLKMKSDISGKQIEERFVNIPIQGHKTRFISTYGNQITAIKVEDISYFFAENKTVYVLTHQNEKFILNQSLELIEKQVDPNIFFRLNRRYLATIDGIKSISKYYNSRLEIKLEPMAIDEVIISQPKCKPFLAWLDK